MRISRGLLALLLVLAATGCGEGRPTSSAAAAPPAARASAPDPVQSANSPAGHDLSADEAMGGHTLARHVGRTDAELIDRLRREPQISTASTYADRATAERVVGAALASAGRAFDTWRRRTGRRPNFVLRYTARETIGRSMSRGQSAAARCNRAVVVLRWDDRQQRFYVLTSYPEVNR